MKEFWECLGVGQVIIAGALGVSGVCLVGQIWVQIAGRTKLYGGPNYWSPGDGAGEYWGSSWLCGLTMAMAGCVIVGVIEIIYCLICPECGGLL